MASGGPVHDASHSGRRRRRAATGAAVAVGAAGLLGAAGMTVAARLFVTVRGPRIEPLARLRLRRTGRGGAA